MTFPSTPRVYYSGEVVYMPKHKNEAGDPICNSAKGLLYKPYYAPTNVAIIHLMFFSSSFNGTKHKLWSDAVNSATWGPWAARCAWSSICNAIPAATNTATGFDIHLVIRCFRNPWDLEFYQMGWFYKDGTEYKSFLDDDDNRYIGKLDGLGGKLPMADNPIVASEEIHPKINFASEFGFTP